MPAIIIDGKKTAALVSGDTFERVAALRVRGIVPCLAVILVGDDPASVSYVTGKKKALVDMGMVDREFRLPYDTGEAELLSCIAALNADAGVHGILVQLPLPPQIDKDRVICAISPAKDVDGFHPVSAGNLVLDQPGFVPATPAAIVRLIRDWDIPLAGRHVVILGRSLIVGKPLANLLVRRELNASVTVCHTGTPDIAVFSRQADILVAAAGCAGLVRADMVKVGAAVIDVSVNRIPDGSKKSGFRLRGDADFDGLLDRAGWITPVPGGVGPMTIAMLMRNVVDAAEGVHSPV